METARQLIQQMTTGQLTSESVVTQCLAHIEKTDAKIKAWAHVDTDGALAQAKAMDQRRAQGKTLGSLHGIPIGLKDIVDTRDMPTERGTSIYQGRQPEANAAVVDHLLEQGAVILGKTVTTELAWMNESDTRNPHNLEHTPGGSSSGSAAAVAAGQVPLAIGTQTGGSVIRPASFNGVYGYKPSRGLISRRGVLQTSPSLDQLGVFARDAGDMALLVDAIKGYDASDSMSYLAPRPATLKGYEADVPVEPHLVWIDMPYKDRYSDSMTDACEEVIGAIQASKANIDRIDAPQSFAALIECHKVIYDYEILRSLNNEWTTHRDQLSATAQAGLKRAEGRSDDEYTEAMDVMKAANDWFDVFFRDYDAVVTPAAIGVAPTLGNGTGDPVTCVIWTLCGLPCVSLPLLTGEHDLPMGLQLVGSYDRDDRLLRTTRWLTNELAVESDT
jgi:Asp-tRNA(Asn)/Glu-tRNA(Gln) amidotransferase A subunit family amidase